MKNIDIGSITSFSNFSNSNDGINFYKKNKVLKQYHEFDDNKLTIWFNVLSERNTTHKIKLIFSDNNDLIDSTCTCSYKNDKLDNCKHIVASYLFYINDLINNLDKNNQYDFSLIEHLTTLNINDTSSTLKYNLEYIINIQSENSVKLDVKIGNVKSYLVPNLRLFVEAFLNNSTYTINNNLQKFRFSTSQLNIDDKYTELIFNALYDACVEKSNSKQYTNYYRILSLLIDNDYQVENCNKMLNEFKKKFKNIAGTYVQDMQFEDSKCIVRINIDTLIMEITEILQIRTKIEDKYILDLNDTGKYKSDIYLFTFEKNKLIYGIVGSKNTIEYQLKEKDTNLLSEIDIY